MPAVDPEQLRTTFDDVAELDDRARPTYPPALLDDLAAPLPVHARVVEIGCGTGKATVPLAERRRTATKAGPPRPPDEIGGLGSETTASGLFRPLAERRYRWDVTYDADGYVAPLDTYSGHRALEPAAREELFARIRRRIAARPNATVRKSCLALLDVGERG